MTGATGYVGRHTLQHFLNNGHLVVALTRNTPKFDHENLNWINGSLEKPETYSDGLKEVDAIVHMAMEYPGNPDRSSADKIAVEAFIDSGKFIAYTGNLYTSYQPGKTITEELLPQGHYWWNDHEAMILNAAQSSAVIRLGFVYGGDGGYLWPGLSPNENGSIPYTGSLDHHWPFVHVEDVARLYEMVITHKSKGIFHATDDKAITVGEILETVTRLQGGTAVEVSLSKAQERLGGFADHMLKDILVTKERAVQFGWKPKHPSFLDSADESYANYLAAQ